MLNILLYVFFETGKMLTDKELQDAISKAFSHRKVNLNACILRAKIKTITGKNVTLRRVMKILNKNNYCIDII